MFKKNGKLCIVLVLCFILQLCLGIQAFAAGNGYSVYLNGTKMELKSEPITKNGHVYIPVEEIAAAGSITISWKSPDVNFRNADHHLLYMIDYSRRTLLYMSADKNVVQLKEYPEKLTEKNNYTLPLYDNGTWEEYKSSMVGIHRAFILENKVPYISTDALEKALHFKVIKDDKAKTVKLERAIPTITFDQYCEQLIKNWYSGLGEEDKNDVDMRYSDLSSETSEDESSDSPTSDSTAPDGLIEAFKDGLLDATNGYFIFDKITEFSAIGDEFVGETLWIQKRVFNDAEGKNPLKGQGFFVKVKIDGFVVEASQSSAYEEETFVAKYLITIAGKQYKVHNDVLFGTSEKDYTRFSVDPKTKFKWAANIWTKLDKGELWAGMTTDMAKMILGAPGKTETTSVKGKKYTLWTYMDSDGYLLGDMLYFDNGKLFIWYQDK